MQKYSMRSGTSCAHSGHCLRMHARGEGHPGAGSNTTTSHVGFFFNRLMLHCMPNRGH